MKDLYLRGNLKPYESDRNRILDCEGLPEDIEAACVVLLDDARKAEYDQCYSVLKVIARARSRLPVPTSDQWRNKYRDFYYAELQQGKNPNEGRAKTVQGFGLSTLKWAGSLAAALLLMFIGSQIYFGNSEKTDSEYDGKVLVKEVYSYKAPIREAADDQSIVLAELERYDEVDVLVGKSTPEWDFVTVASNSGEETIEGYVFNEHLSIGNNEAEEIQRCAELGFERLSNGTVLSALQEGNHRLTVVNTLAQDIVLKLKNRSNVDIVSVYMWGHQTSVFDNIPDGSYKVSIARGKNYSPACGRFLEQMQAGVDRRTVKFGDDDWSEEEPAVTEVTYILENNSGRYDPIPARLF